MPVEDEIVGGSDAAGGAGLVDAEEQRIIENSRSLDDGAAAGAPAQDRDLMVAAVGEVDLGVRVVGVAKDDEMTGRFPEAEQLILPAVLAEVEQGLIAGEVFLGRRQGQVADFHNAEKRTPQHVQCSAASVLTGVMLYYFVGFWRGFSSNAKR